MSLPAELEEAAFVDGAGHWTVFSRIVLPLVRRRSRRSASSPSSRAEQLRSGSRDHQLAEADDAPGRDRQPCRVSTYGLLTRHGRNDDQRHPDRRRLPLAQMHIGARFRPLRVQG